MTDNIYLAILHSIWIAQKKLFSIFEKNQNYKEFYENINQTLLRDFWFSDKQIESILEKKEKIKIEQIEKKLIEREVSIITILDYEYPDLLRKIPNPPYLLYVRWKLDNSPKLAIVWSRNITSYWEKVIEKLIPELSKYFIIVSGWAIWCDTKAHSDTISTWNKTISVIGTWIDLDYPTWNKKMFDKIVELWWAVVSIFPLWEVWNAYNFPIRNEIVAWLSVWTIIVEAKEKSWSLITANLTLDLWRDLFAIPWEIFKSNSEWCNTLIYNWSAKIVRKTSDILEEYNINSWNNENKNTKIIFYDKIEEDIYKNLILQSLTIDEITKILKSDISTISFKISMMEINMIVKKWIGWKYEVV